MTERLILADMGTGPVQGATEQEALRNIGVFIGDLRAQGLVTDLLTYRPDSSRDDGRYTCDLLFEDGRVVEIRMPGLPLDRVRWMADPSQHIKEFPRLYVDGGSWVWWFALGVCVAEGNGGHE
jgi:hypothetical protein